VRQHGRHQNNAMNDWFHHERPLIIGHRGASSYAPENSLAAVALAAEQGADGVEFDVQLSADGHPVLMHDSTVDRTSNGRGRVSDLTLAELKRLDLGDGQTVPTLEELFSTFGSQLLYNVEIKAWNIRGQGLETAVAQAIARHKLAARVVVSSFNPLVLRRIRPQLPPPAGLGLLRYRGLLQYSYLITPSDADHPHHTMVHEAYMRWARRRGQRVNVWTVDDPAEAQRLTRLGVQAIITNKPDIIREAVKATP
jgi:glycerophosphoryl diester phosphodiesterase